MAKRVLVVDDDDDTRTGLEEMLQSADVHVSAAEGQEEATALLMGDNYCVVIADLMLSSSSPGDGLELVRYVKTHCEKTKVIVITGCGEPDIMERAHAAGADLFYAKPVGSGVLKEAIRRLCS